MDIATEPIVSVIGKGADDKYELGSRFICIVDRLSMSTVARVCEVLWQATATLTSVKRGCSV